MTRKSSLINLIMNFGQSAKSPNKIFKKKTMKKVKEVEKKDGKIDILFSLPPSRSINWYQQCVRVA